MNLIALLYASALLLLPGCLGGRGTSDCATPLKYVPNKDTSGQNAVTNAGVYYAGAFVGNENYFVSLKLDTGSADLVINEGDYLSGAKSRIGKAPFIFENQEAKSIALNGTDNVNIGCAINVPTRFDLTARTFATPNILGLAFGDSDRQPHEGAKEAFFDQFVRKGNFNDVISLALCGTGGGSHVLLGGIDEKMSIGIGKFIPIIERSSYVVPALSLRRADNKRMIGSFPSYDPSTKTGRKTILDSATSFNLLPTEMASAMAYEVQQAAKEKNLENFFPKGFFRTERSIATRVVRFANMAQIRQFPTFEINFWGTDGKTKALELSPLHYFKEMDSEDPLVRTFAIRDTDQEVVLGQPFLENHYVVFDRSGGRVGFGNIDIACTAP